MLADPSNQQRQEAFQSPGLEAGPGHAYELKFRLTEAEAQWVEAWARDHLVPDPHGDNGSYRITTLYSDTPQFDVFHRSSGYKRTKYRLRRYDSASRVYLEKKYKQGDRVRKQRVDIPDAELEYLDRDNLLPTWSGLWFRDRLQDRKLGPACRVAYQRRAFFAQTSTQPLRLTLDRDLLGLPAQKWDVAPLWTGRPLLPGGVLLELKYHLQLPLLFQELLPHLPLQPARVSKYRLCVQLCELNGCANGTLRPPSLLVPEESD